MSKKKKKPFKLFIPMQEILKKKKKKELLTLIVVVVVFEGVHKVLHQLPEPAAPQHEPHRQQALQLRCLWQKLLAGANPEETPTHSHIHTGATQARTKTGTVSLHFVFNYIPLKSKGSILISHLQGLCKVLKCMQTFILTFRSGIC